MKTKISNAIEYGVYDAHAEQDDKNDENADKDDKSNINDNRDDNKYLEEGGVTNLLDDIFVDESMVEYQNVEHQGTSDDE